MQSTSHGASDVTPWDWTAKRGTLAEECAPSPAPPHELVHKGRYDTIVALYLNRRLWPFTALNSWTGDRRPLVRTDAADMLKRRLKQAGLPAHYSPHSFRATGITNFLENDGTLEAAQRIAGHADSRISPYKKAIDKALDSATVLVAIDTSRPHLDSEWVRYEWDSFYNDILTGIKPNGSVFTYIDGMTTMELPRALRQTQTFVHSEAELKRLCNYINKALQLARAS